MNVLPRTLAGAVIVFTAAILVALGIVAVAAHARYGWPGVTAAAAAAAVCWFGCILGLVLTKLFQGTPNALSGLLGAMALRTGVPLAGGFVVATNVPALPAAGFVGWILIFYLPALLFETILSVRLIGLANKESKVS